MLKSLQNIEPNTARAVLAAAVSTFLPSADPEKELESAKQFGSLYDAVIQDARGKFSIKKNSDPSVTKTHMLRVLSSELTTITLPPQAAKAIGDRLGDEGALPNRLYEIRFLESLSLNMYKDLYSRDQVFKAIRNPDQFKHLYFSDDVVTEQSPASLYLKRITEGNESFYLLVQTMRTQQTLTVTDVFRIYDTMIDNQYVSLIDLVRNFAVRYGAPFTLPDSDTERSFIIDELISLPEDMRGITDQKLRVNAISSLFKHGDPEDTGVSSFRTVLNLTKDGKRAYVMLAYAISDSLYRDAINKAKDEIKIRSGSRSSIAGQAG